MDLRERYGSLDESALDRFVDQGREENLYLEFKTLGDASLSSRLPRKTLARMISGFADAQGGIIVWGLRADSGPDQNEPEVAREKVPTGGFDRLLPRSNELTAEVTSPIEAEVEHRAIAVDGNEGFGTTFVPETASDPVMAKLGHDRYFKRSGDSFPPFNNGLFQDARIVTKAEMQYYEGRNGQRLYPQTTEYCITLQSRYGAKNDAARRFA